MFLEDLGPNPKNVELTISSNIICVWSNLLDETGSHILIPIL